MKKQTSDKFEDLTGKIISWVGSKPSLYIHTFIFIGCFALLWLDVGVEEILLILTTAVSLEAIYLAIFIQYSVNQQARTLKNVAHDIEEVTEDVDELSEDVEDISEDVEDISEDVEGISEDVEQLSGALSNRVSSEKTAGILTYESLEQQLKHLLFQVQQLKQQSDQSNNNNIAAKNESGDN